ncbi:uncharacterized protein LOC107999843 isoform X2 [Apis cerana]|uniref:uncharacterized protein LOC107999843 isoform X2 n=1 Tax=Apis cerana TaxID=7461 RepID=UPI002B235E60|nr:uncharacterized protein LOC107999843 isoform X2 [Apis cerana]
MRPIGWAMACALLASTFPKSASLLISAEEESVGVVATAHRHPTGRGKLTKLLPISKDTAPDPDTHRLEQFIDDERRRKRRSVQEGTRREGRTFGHKRIQFMLMPMMYKMGVMMTMLIVLTAISVKGLLVGAMLLMLKLSTLIAKFSFGWQHNAQAPQPIHVHVHNSPPTAHNQAYSGWIPGSGSGGEHHYYYRA